MYDTIGVSEGLSNPKVLTLYERADGSILPGTDGNGIAVIEKGCVTENGLCYLSETVDMQILDDFPHYNNYDIVPGKDGGLFVLGSAGIYVVNKTNLLEGKELSYELLDFKRGLCMELTPNSWNYMDNVGNLYLSGETGVVCMNLNQNESMSCGGGRNTGTGAEADT